MGLEFNVLRRFAVLLLFLCIGSTALADGFWITTCRPGNLPCHVVGGAIVIWWDGQSRLKGLARHPDVTRVYLRDGNQRQALGDGRFFELAEFHLQLLTHPGARIEAEFTDTRILSHSAHSLVSAIRALPSPKQTPVAGPLSHFAFEADQRTSAPSFLVPSTKPQVEFAIRAQGGQSIFSGSGR